MRVQVEHEKSFIEVEQGGKVKKYEVVPPSMPAFRKILAIQELAVIFTSNPEKVKSKQWMKVFDDLEEAIKDLFPKGHLELLKLPMTSLVKVLHFAVASMQAEKKTPDAGKRSYRSRRSA